MRLIWQNFIISNVYMIIFLIDPEKSDFFSTLIQSLYYYNQFSSIQYTLLALMSGEQ